AASSFPPSPPRCPPQMPCRPPSQSAHASPFTDPLVLWPLPLVTCPFTIVVPGGAGVPALTTVPWPSRNLARKPNPEPSHHHQPVQITAPSQRIVRGISTPFEESPIGGEFWSNLNLPQEVSRSPTINHLRFRMCHQV